MSKDPPRSKGGKKGARQRTPSPRGGERSSKKSPQKHWPARPEGPLDVSWMKKYVDNDETLPDITRAGAKRCKEFCQAWHQWNAMKGEDPDHIPPGQADVFVRKFLHSLRRRAVDPKPLDAALDRWPAPLCKWHAEGFCNFRDSCCFRHDGPPGQGMPDDKKAVGKGKGKDGKDVKEGKDGKDGKGKGKGPEKGKSKEPDKVAPPPPDLDATNFPSAQRAGQPSEKKAAPVRESVWSKPGLRPWEKQGEPPPKAATSKGHAAPEEYAAGDPADSAAGPQPQEDSGCPVGVAVNNEVRSVVTAFAGTTSAQLTVKVGDWVEVTFEKVRGQWSYGRIVDPDTNETSSSGYLPDSCFEQPKVVRKKYVSPADGYLSLEVGIKVVVTHHEGDWEFGHVKGFPDMTGWFPADVLT